MNINEYKCIRCGYVWEPRTKEPKSCPRCKQYKVKRLEE